MKTDNQERREDIPLATLFITKAEAVAAKVSVIATVQEAMDYTANLCERIRTESVQPTVAAPGLDQEEMELLRKTCLANDISCVSDSLRGHVSDIDVGLTYGDYGIADTGTVVLNCPEEELRLATMISDYHVCILPKSKLVNDSTDLDEQLNKFMQNTPNYTAFITGPSRTADIERVLTIGVHGPLELHVLLLEDQ